MPTDIQIIPAILATTEEEYREKIEKVSTCPEFAEGWVQIDIMDGKFVQNQSVGPQVLEKYPTESKIEAHLMIQDPSQAIFYLIEAGVKRIVLHVESDGVGDNLAYIEDEGVENGLAINPETSLEKSAPYLKDVDTVLIMSVYPGAQGRDFIPESLEKIRECSRMRAKGNLNFKIEVDGGISVENAKLVLEAGADRLIIGEYLINGNIAENLEKIRQSLRD